MDAEMSVELKSRLVKAIDAIEEGARHTGEFVKDEAPVVAREIALAGAVKGLAIGGVEIAMLCFASWAMAKRVGPIVVEAVKKGDCPLDVFGVIGSLIAIGCVTSGWVNVIPRIEDGITAALAPRVYVLEYVADLLR